VKTPAAIVLIFLSALLINGAFDIAALIQTLTHSLDERSNCGKNNRGIAEYLPANEAEKRFGPLKPYLAGHERVGYICDLEKTKAGSKELLVDIDSMGRLILAQYVLVPIIVEHESDFNSKSKSDLVALDLRNSNPHKFLEECKLDLVKDFGNGVFLGKRR